MFSLIISEKRKVKDIFYDIDLLYRHIRLNGNIIDEWHFQNNFTQKYWLYLKNYKWLEKDELILLHTGAFNIILFHIYHFLENNNSFIVEVKDEVEQHLKSYHSRDYYSSRLCEIVIESLNLVSLKQSTIPDTRTDGMIYKYISWTLENTILLKRKVVGKEN